MKKNVIKFATLGLALIMVSCGGGEASNDAGTEAPAAEKEKKEEVVSDPMSNKGVGPITEVTLADAIDETMAAAGKALYEGKCTACHKLDKKFIGPSPVGVLERRTPEWIMNMILDPEGMVKNDPDARKLLMEYNGAPMANQSLTEDEARSILEYFRTI